MSGLQKPFGALSEEAVVAADPQVVIFPSNDNGQIVTVDGQLKRLRASAAWSRPCSPAPMRISSTRTASLPPCSL